MMRGVIHGSDIFAVEGWDGQIRITRDADLDGFISIRRDRNLTAISIEYRQRHWARIIRIGRVFGVSEGS